MGKMRKRSLICLLLILVVTMGACDRKVAPTPEAENKPEVGTPGVEKEPGELTWLEAAKLDEIETSEELYEAAKAAGETTITVYSKTGRMAEVAELFEKEYPGMKVEAYKMRMSEIFEKFSREYESGIRNADLIFASDSDGVVYNEFFKTGMLHGYAPEDLLEHVDEAYTTFGYQPSVSRRAVYYNTEVYDESPIKSWWDLTKPEYKGKLTFQNPVINPDILALFTTIVQNADDMEKDYKEVFGEDIVLDGTENASYEFLKRLLANDPVLTSSEGDVVTAIGTGGQENPPFGIATSSKLTEREDKGLHIGIVKDLKPKDGMVAPTIVAITDQCENINLAKLMVRFLGGESDGKGPGFGPFYTEGNWPTRTDLPPVGNAGTLDDLNLWPLDLEFNYDNSAKVRDFLITLQ